jgi:hypothetical protein
MLRFVAVPLNIHGQKKARETFHSAVPIFDVKLLRDDRFYTSFA